MFALLLSCCLLIPTHIDSLPPAWHGTWQGPLQLTGSNNQTSIVPFKLVIQPLTDKTRVTWHITYGEGDKASTRLYELVATPDKPGHYELDEKTGLRMKEKLVGNQLYCLFKTGNVLIHVKHDLQGDVLHYDLTTYQVKEPLKAEHNKNADITVDSYVLVSRQTAELKRVR